MALYIKLLGKAYGYKLIEGRLWLGTESSSGEDFLKQPSVTQPIGHFVHRDGGLEPLTGLIELPARRIVRFFQGCKFVKYPEVRSSSLDAVKGPPIKTLTQADEAQPGETDV